jgi:hypothetical protein
MTELLVQEYGCKLLRLNWLISAEMLELKLLDLILRARFNPNAATLRATSHSSTCNQTTAQQRYGAHRWATVGGDTRPARAPRRIDGARRRCRQAGEGNRSCLAAAAQPA